MNGRGHFLARASRLNRVQWRLLGRATLVLSASSILLGIGGFRRAIGFGAVPLWPRPTGVRVTDVIWAVEAAARRVPFRAKCIEQGIAAQRMLRQSGIDARLHYGARSEGEDRALKAHVWVSVAGKPVIGGEEAAGFAQIAVYP